MNKRNDIKPIYQHLLNYINGKRKGAEANSIERQAMHDMFLDEALEGIDSTEGNHAENIKLLQDKIMQNTSKRSVRHRRFMFWGAAASMNVIFTWSAAACAGLLIAGGLIYFASSGSTGEQLAAGNGEQLIYSNSFLAKAHSSDIDKEIMIEEYLSVAAVEPPMPKISEMHNIEQETFEIIERSIKQKHESIIKQDSIIADMHKIEYVEQKQLEPEAYVNENIPIAIQEEYPKFMGQDANSFKDWIQKKLKYPDRLAEDVQGEVVLSFVIDSDGNLTSVNVVKKLTPECDAEAVRTVLSSPKWTPAKQNSIPVDFEFIFPISFKLD